MNSSTITYAARISVALVLALTLLLGSVRPIPTARAADEAAARVNAGGSAYTDTAGRSWSADGNYTGGETYATTAPIAGTEDDDLYRSERFGSFAYGFPLPDGNYTVTLRFAEIYWQRPGQRIFDVMAEGRRVLSNFDILSEVAPNTALDKTFVISVTDGSLDLRFARVVNLPKVSAIEIVSGGTPDTTPPAISATTPAANATGVPIISDVEVVFDEAMDGSFIDTAKFALAVRATGMEVPARVIYQSTDRRAVLNPDRYLTPNTTYTATVKGGANGVLDLAGNGMATDMVWSFTTAAGSSGGLTGQYFDNPDFTGLTLTRTDPAVRFNWSIRSPDPSLGADTFSVRWSGQVKVDHSEEYTFYTRSDDGVRLWIGDRKLIDNWTSHESAEDSGSVALVAGRWYPITLEYFEDTYVAEVSLLYQSASTTKQVIPTEQLRSTPVTDTVRPTVASTVPVAGSTGVPAAAPVTATFSEAMEPSTITTATFRLSPAGSRTPLPVTVTYDPASKKATLNPDADLQRGVSYAATITTGATDLAGNGMATTKSWTFATAASDSTAPKVTQRPVPALPSGQRLGTGSIPVRASWSATDAGGSGVARYQLQVRTYSSSVWGAWGWASQGTTTRSLIRHLRTGQHQFRVRAEDRAGNRSVWVAGPSFRLSALQESAAKIVQTGVWSRQAMASAYGGALEYATNSGARARLTFTGRGIAWVAPKGPSRGTAKVYIDGTHVRTVDLQASAFTARTIVYARSWSTVGEHTIEIRVSGTAGRPRVDLDALTILR